MAKLQQLQPRYQTRDSTPHTQRSHRAGGQFDCERYTIQSSAHLGDERRLAVGENEIAASSLHALDKELNGWIAKHDIRCLPGIGWREIEGKDTAAMFALYLQQFTTRGQ